jgi:FemAB-related protein (PEP-CTERM system-associated)
VSGIRVQVAGIPDREAWESFVAAAPGSEAAHRWELHEALRRVFGVELIRLVALRGTTWAAVLPLVFQRSLVGRFLTSVPYLNHAGVLGSDPEGRRALAEEATSLAARLRVDRLELRGRDGSDLPVEEWRGKAAYVLDLPSVSGALWESLGAKLRAQVKRPAREGYETTVGGSEGRTRFYPMLARKWHQLGSPVLPERFFAEIEAVFGPDLEYVTVERSGESAAAGVLLFHRGGVEIPWASSSPEHDRFGVNMQLYWRALERAVERKATAFDFGRSTPGSGNARFKLQWGAVEAPLRWNVLLRDARGRAGERGDSRRGLVASAWKRLPGFVVRRLGPVLAARIPY